MGASTLRQKFGLGIAVIVVVSLVFFSCVRYLGKGARFQFLEREHYVLVSQMENKLHAIADGARGAESLTRDYIFDHIAKADRLALTPWVELNAAERWFFRLLGFGFVIDLPDKDRVDLAGFKAIIDAEPGTGFTPDFVKKLTPYLDAVVADSNEFGPTMARGVETMKLIFLTLALISIAALVLTILLLRRNTLPPVQYALDLVNIIRSGDLTQKIQVTTRDEMGELHGGIKEMQETIARLTRQVRAHSEHVFDSTRQLVSGNQNLSSRTEHQASTVEEASATVEELSGTVRGTAQRALEVKQHTENASNIAAQGGAIVAQVVQTMGTIRESSLRISEITSVIDSIAFQTNILALNAAVEAARAGDQGRGFAVVATEVRSLAQRVAAAAKEIKHLVEDSAEKVNQGSALVKDAGETMTNILDAVRGVSALVFDITQSTNEQADGVDQLGQAIQQIDDISQQNAALVEQASAAAESLERRAQELVQMFKAYKLDDHEQKYVPRTAKPLVPTRSTPRVAQSSTPQKPPTAKLDEEWTEF